MSRSFTQSVYQEKTRGDNLRVKRLNVHDSSKVLLNRSTKYEQVSNNDEAVDCDSAKCSNCRETHKSIKMFSGKLGKIEQLVNALQKKTEQYHNAKEGTFLKTQFHVNDKLEESNAKKNWLPSQALSKCSLNDLNALVMLAGINTAPGRPRQILPQTHADLKVLKYRPSLQQRTISQSPRTNSHIPGKELKQFGNHSNSVKSTLLEPSCIVPSQDFKTTGNHIVNQVNSFNTKPLGPKVFPKSAGSHNVIYQQSFRRQHPYS